MKIWHIQGYYNLYPFQNPSSQILEWILLKACQNLESKDVILVVVDRLTKYSHFIALSHLFTISMMAATYLDYVYKLHSNPSATGTNRGPTFTSIFWQ